MSFALPAALALLATALILVLLTLLRSRQRRRDVAAFFVWRELRDSTSYRTRRLRSLLDPLFLVQLGVLVAAVLAVAQPIWTSRHSGLTSLALVVDASASMSTVTESRTTLYELAVQRAGEILDDCRPASVSVVLLSANPRILVAREANAAQARAALAASDPSWEGDGQEDDLVRTLEAIGGASEYDQVIFLTDHSPTLAALPVRVDVLSGEEGVGITAFSVRENPNGMGVSAFTRLLNQTGEPLTLALHVADETNETRLDALIGPREEAAFVVPFPTSRGSRFTASIDVTDASTYDNVRYASLQRSAALRLYWIGRENRYLDAALDAAAPIVRVDSTPADLTVVYDAELDRLPEGNVLLVHSRVRDVVEIGPQATSGAVRAVSEDPLLAGIQAEDIYVERLPSVEVLLPSRPLLSVAESAFLLRISDPTRLVAIIPSDLSATNFPITVDFPLLVRNLIEQVAPSQATSISDWTLVGSPTRLPTREGLAEVVDPAGRPLALLPDQEVFFPTLPGQYVIRAAGEERSVSVNVAPGETQSRANTNAASITEFLPPTASAAVREHRSPLWPLVAAAALVLLLLEFPLYRRSRSEPRRPA